MDRPLCRDCGETPVRKKGTSSTGKQRWHVRCSACETERDREKIRVQAQDREGALLARVEALEGDLVAAVADAFDLKGENIALNRLKGHMEQKLNEATQELSETTQKLSETTQTLDRIRVASVQELHARRNAEAALSRLKTEVEAVRQELDRSADRAVSAEQVFVASLAAKDAQIEEVGLQVKALQANLEAKEEEIVQQEVKWTLLEAKLSQKISEMTLDLNELDAASAKAADNLIEAHKLSEIQLSVIERLNADLEGSGRRRARQLGVLAFSNNLIWLALWLLLR
jgi:chromosome segregation ATPase